MNQLYLLVKNYLEPTSLNPNRNAAMNLARPLGHGQRMATEVDASSNKAFPNDCANDANGTVSKTTII